ncbi:Hypothetical protein PHPALM_19677 [Phytophthora palmivora]|uniref:Uncharacterized protein n=1 Tax=Phytophthora palmivora TaxID=4796 RepID=A0A2P4XGT1_9STRA|nr:Hypothetical protein PHPALM_19677 [Phytophthora palmivora]
MWTSCLHPTFAKMGRLTAQKQQVTREQFHAYCENFFVVYSSGVVEAKRSRVPCNYSLGAKMARLCCNFCSFRAGFFNQWKCSNCKEKHASAVHGSRFGGHPLEQNAQAVAASSSLSS